MNSVNQDVCKLNPDLIEDFKSLSKDYDDKVKYDLLRKIELIDNFKPSIKAVLFTLTGCVDMSFDKHSHNYEIGNKFEINLMKFFEAINYHISEVYKKGCTLGYDDLCTDDYFIQVFNECSYELFGWKYDIKYPSEFFDSVSMIRQDKTIGEWWLYEVCPLFWYMTKTPLILVIFITLPFFLLWVLLCFIFEEMFTIKWSFEVRGL